MDNQRTTPMPAAVRRRAGTQKLAILAMLAAVAYVVMYLSKLIPVNVLGFLNFDLKDVVITIGGFIYGPLAAAGVSVVVSVIEMVTVSDTGPIGLLMNVLSTCAFSCTAAFIYKKLHTVRGAVIGLVSGMLGMTAIMLLWNYLITPIYMGIPRQSVAELLVPYMLPFNLIKSGINAALTMLVYKPVVRALRAARLIEASTGAPGGAGQKTGVLIVALVALATFIMLALVLAGIL